MHLISRGLKHTIRQPPFLSPQKGGRHRIFNNELFYLVVLFELFLCFGPHLVGFRDILLRQIGILKLGLLIPLILILLPTARIIVLISIVAKVTKISSYGFVARKIPNVNHFPDILFVIIFANSVFLKVFLIPLPFQFVEYFSLFLVQSFVIDCIFDSVQIRILKSMLQTLGKPLVGTYLNLLLLFVRRYLVHSSRVLLDELLMVLLVRLFLMFAEYFKFYSKIEIN